MDEGANHLFNTILKRLDKIETKFIILEDAYVRHLTCECNYREELKTTIGKMAIRISELAGLHNRFVEDTDNSIDVLNQAKDAIWGRIAEIDLRTSLSPAKRLREVLIKEGVNINLSEKPFTLRDKKQMHGCQAGAFHYYYIDSVEQAKAEILRLLELKAKHYSNLIHLKDAEEIINEVFG